MRTLSSVTLLLAATACGAHTADLGGTPSDSGTGEAGDPSALFLQSVLAPPPGDSSGAGCLFTDDPTQATLSEGILDVGVIGAFAGEYKAEILAGNRLTGTGATETTRIAIESAKVTVEDAAGNALGSFTTYGAASIAPPSSHPSYAPVGLTLVDAATIASLRNRVGPGQSETIVTRTQALGKTLGGEPVASNVFEFPIKVCNGCLVTYDTDPSVTPRPNCDGPAPAGGPLICFYGQDLPIDCHSCLTKPICKCGKASCP